MSMMSVNSENISLDSFGEIYNQYVSHALRLAYALLHDQSAAEDAVQEAFIRAYYHREKFDKSKKFKPWFDRILINECKRILGRRKQFMDIEEAERMEDFSSSADESDEIQTLRSSIDRLAPKYKEVILLKYMQGYSEVEIAQILLIPRSTVKSRLFEARNKLKSMMMEDD